MQRINCSCSTIFRDVIVTILLFSYALALRFHSRVIINIPCSKYFLFKFYEQYSFIFGQYNVNFNYFSNQKIRQTSCFLLVYLIILKFLIRKFLSVYLGSNLNACFEHRFLTRNSLRPLNFVHSLKL